MTSAIRDRFNEIARDYDRQRRQLIPCFDDFYGMAVALTESTKPDPVIIDLGAGTGLLSVFVADTFPAARLTLVDLAEDMLAMARRRFDGRPGVDFVVADYSNYTPPVLCDLVISSLSIHHLEDDAKRRLYASVHAMLADGGLFINADQVCGATPALEAWFRSRWRAFIEASGLSAEEIRSAYTRTVLDRMATLDDNLRWLREAGFADVGAAYQYQNFAVFRAVKCS